MDIIRRRLLVRGHVQGVWFRQSTADEAARIGDLKGWVCNLADGSVAALVEGPAAKVDALVAYLHRGPERARVEHVDVVEESVADDGLGPFAVRR